MTRRGVVSAILWSLALVGAWAAAGGGPGAGAAVAVGLVAGWNLRRAAS